MPESDNWKEWTREEWKDFITDDLEFLLDEVTDRHLGKPVAQQFVRSTRQFLSSILNWLANDKDLTIKQQIAVVRKKGSIGRWLR